MLAYCELCALAHLARSLTGEVTAGGPAWCLTIMRPGARIAEFRFRHLSFIPGCNIGGAATAVGPWTSWTRSSDASVSPRRRHRPAFFFSAATNIDPWSWSQLCVQDAGDVLELWRFVVSKTKDKRSAVAVSTHPLWMRLNSHRTSSKYSRAPFLLFKTSKPYARLDSHIQSFQKEKHRSPHKTA